MQQSTVKWFDAKKGYGFINHPEKGDDVFVHYSQIQTDQDFKTLRTGQEVAFEMNDGPKGLHAIEVKPLGEEAEETPSEETSSEKTSSEHVSERPPAAPEERSFETEERSFDKESDRTEPATTSDLDGNDTSPGEDELSRTSAPATPSSSRASASEKPTSEKPTSEKPTSEKPTSEKPTSEKPTSEKPDSGQPPPDTRADSESNDPTDGPSQQTAW